MLLNGQEHTKKYELGMEQLDMGLQKIAYAIGL
jgi:hypothetical protein